MDVGAPREHHLPQPRVPRTERHVPGRGALDAGQDAVLPGSGSGEPAEDGLHVRPAQLELRDRQFVQGAGQVPAQLAGRQMADVHRRAGLRQRGQGLGQDPQMLGEGLAHGLREDRDQVHHLGADLPEPLVGVVGDAGGLGGEPVEPPVLGERIGEVQRAARHGLVDDGAEFPGRPVPAVRGVAALRGEPGAEQPVVRAVARQVQGGEMRGQQVVQRRAGVAVGPVAQGRVPRRPAALVEAPLLARGDVGQVLLALQRPDRLDHALGHLHATGHPGGQPGEVQLVVRRQPDGAVGVVQVLDVGGGEVGTERRQGVAHPCVQVHRVAEQRVPEPVGVDSLAVQGQAAVDVLAEDVHEGVGALGQPPREDRLEERHMPAGEIDGLPGREQRPHGRDRALVHQQPAGGAQFVPGGGVPSEDDRIVPVGLPGRRVDRAHQVRHRGDATGDGHLVPPGGVQRSGEPLREVLGVRGLLERVPDGAFVRPGELFPFRCLVTAAVPLALAGEGQAGGPLVVARRGPGLEDPPRGPGLPLLLVDDDLSAGVGVADGRRGVRGGRSDGLDAVGVFVGDLLGGRCQAVGAVPAVAGEDQLAGAAAEAEAPHQLGAAPADRRAGDAGDPFGRHHVDGPGAPVRGPDRERRPVARLHQTGGQRDGERLARAPVRRLVDGPARHVEETGVDVRPAAPVGPGETGLAEQDAAGRAHLAGDDRLVPAPFGGPHLLVQRDEGVLQAGRQVPHDVMVPDAEHRAVRVDDLVIGEARERRELVGSARFLHPVDHQVPPGMPARLGRRGPQDGGDGRLRLEQRRPGEDAAVGGVGVRALERARLPLGPQHRALGLRQEHRGAGGHLRVLGEFPDELVGDQGVGHLPQPLGGPLPGVAGQAAHRRIPQHHQRQAGRRRALVQARQPGQHLGAQPGPARCSGRGEVPGQERAVGPAQQEQRDHVGGAQGRVRSAVRARPPPQRVTAPEPGVGSLAGGGTAGDVLLHPVP